MIEIQRILCPMDFSDFSRRALDHAMVLAKWYGATAQVLHVYYAVPMATMTPEMLPTLVLTPQLREELLTSVRRFVSEDAIGGVPLSFEVVEGTPARTIVDTARSSRADLLVLGTHGRSGFEHAVIGSVAERALRQASCPVLTVPKGGPDAMPVPPPFKRILCAIDFLRCSMRALEYATAIAQEADACLTVAHVFELEGAMPAHWRDMFTPQSIQRELLAVEEDRPAQLACGSRACHAVLPR